MTKFPEYPALADALARAEKAEKELAALRAALAQAEAVCRMINGWLGTYDGAIALPIEPPWYQELLAVIRNSKGPK